MPNERSTTKPFEDRSAAEKLAQRLRVEVGPGAKVAVKPISAVRAWLIRQELFGNHGE